MVYIEMPELYASFFNEQDSDINASKYLSQIMKASIKNLGSKQPSPIDTENGVKKNKAHFDATVQHLTRAVRMLEVASVEVGDYPNAGLHHPIIKAIDYITSATYSLGEIDIDFLDANMLLKMKKLFDDFFNVIEGIREKELSDFGALESSGTPLILTHLDEAADNLLQKAKFFMDYGRRVLERSPGNLPDEDDSDDEDEDSDDDDSDDDDSNSEGGDDIQNRRIHQELDDSDDEDSDGDTKGSPYLTPTSNKPLTGLTPYSDGPTPHKSLSAQDVAEYRKTTDRYRKAEANEELINQLRTKSSPLSPNQTKLSSRTKKKRLRIQEQAGRESTPVSPKSMSYQTFAKHWAKKHGMTYKEALRDPEQIKARKNK